ncbi:hypothetical protein ABZ299_30265, partial [Streptomyces sp. NPDC006184]
MTGKTGKTGAEDTRCPGCGTPRAPDRTPSCDCTERAAEALRETRTAEVAAAEDFDPLRIRPYVGMRDAPGALSLRVSRATSLPEALTGALSELKELWRARQVLAVVEQGDVPGVQQVEAAARGDDGA